MNNNQVSINQHGDFLVFEKEDRVVSIYDLSVAGTVIDILPSKNYGEFVVVRWDNMPAVSRVERSVCLL